MTKKLYTATFILLSFTPGFSQELILNGNAEEFINCPTDREQLYYAKGYSSPNKTTADYFNVCASKGGDNSVSVPTNFAGYIKPHSGNAYTGFYPYSVTCTNVSTRKYLQVSLLEPLRKDSIYLLSMYVNLGKRSNACLTKMGVAFSEKQVSVKTDKRVDMPAQLVFNSSDSLMDKNSWHRLEGHFKAKGNEQFLIIGMFEKDDSLHTCMVLWDNDPRHTKFMYYYVDDISLKQVNKPVWKTEVGSRIVMKNIYFDSDKTELLPASYPELNNLLQLMKDKSTLEIEIVGHTDNSGTEARNKALSEGRSKSVYSYLIEKGISPGRIKYKGMGSSKPVVNNSTFEGREQNRRVEFVVTKQ